MKLVLFLIVCISLTVATHDSILFRDIKTLLLYKNQMTKGRRSSPIRQIKCVGGDACRYFTPEVIRCTNIGTNDKGEVQWKCQAEMEDLYRLGRTTVSCEGYHRAGDPLVLQGSCGVEYTLHLTEKGKDRYLVHQNQEKSAFEFIPVVMAILGVGALIFFIAFCVSAAMNSSPPPPPPIRGRQARPERNSEFFEGYMMGSAVTRNPSPVRQRHHHTSTTIINNNNNNNRTSASDIVVVEVKKKVRRSPKKSKSTGYGGSVSRGQNYDTWSTTTTQSESYSTSNDDNDDDKDESSSSSTSTSTYTSTGYGAAQADNLIKLFT